MKKSRIIAPALGVLVLSTAASITGTVAWFTANNSVTVTGMAVRTKVSSNLLISSTTTEQSFAAAPLNQVQKGILEPVSTANGGTFYYTVKAQGDGSAVASGYGENVEYVLYNSETASTTPETYLNKFSEDYGLNKTDAGNMITGETGAKAYVDYTYYLKATSTEASQKVSLKVAKLLYNNDVASQKAWRAAFFTSAGQSSVTGLGEAETSLLSVIAPTGATYFTSGQGVSGVHAKTAVTNLNAAVTIDANVGAGVTRYYKVVTRLWLEGEDTTCTNETFANLNESWTLDLELELGANAGVTAIKTSDVDVELSNSNKTATAALNIEGTTPSYQWYNASTKVAIDSATNAAYTNAANEAIDVYCVVTSNAVAHTSHTVTLAAANA